MTTTKNPQELADDVAIAAGEMCPDCGCKERIDFGMRYGY
jgi:hypothetical protein